MSRDNPTNDPRIEEYLRDPEVKKGLDAIEEHERGPVLEAMSPEDHARSKYGQTEDEREPARRVRLSEATSDDHAAHMRGEVELIPDESEEA